MLSVPVSWIRTHSHTRQPTKQTALRGLLWPTADPPRSERLFLTPEQLSTRNRWGLRRRSTMCWEDDSRVLGSTLDVFMLSFTLMSLCSALHWCLYAELYTGCLYHTSPLRGLGMDPQKRQTTTRARGVGWLQGNHAFWTSEQRWTYELTEIATVRTSPAQAQARQNSSVRTVWGGQSPTLRPGAIGIWELLEEGHQLSSMT